MVSPPRHSIIVKQNAVCREGDKWRKGAGSMHLNQPARHLVDTTLVGLTSSERHKSQQTQQTNTGRATGCRLDTL